MQKSPIYRKISKKVVRWFIFYSQTSFFGFLILSYTNMPPEKTYNPLVDMMSYLGDFHRNYTGWYFFSIAIFVLGLSYLLITIYLHQIFREFYATIAKFSTFFTGLTAITYMIVAFIPDSFGATIYKLMSFGQLHSIIAPLVFIGVIGANFTHLIFLSKIYLKPEKKRKMGNFSVILILELIMTGLFIIILILQSLAIAYNFTWPYPGIFSFSIWEWLVILLYNTTFILLPISFTPKNQNL